MFFNELLTHHTRLGLPIPEPLWPAPNAADHRHRTPKGANPRLYRLLRNKDFERANHKILRFANKQGPISALDFEFRNSLSSLRFQLRSFTSLLVHFFTVHCSQSTVHCSLLTVHCSLSTAHCPLFTVHCSLSTVHRSLLPCV